MDLKKPSLFAFLIVLSLAFSNQSCTVYHSVAMEDQLMDYSPKPLNVNESSDTVALYSDLGYYIAGGGRHSIQAFNGGLSLFYQINGFSLTPSVRYATGNNEVSNYISNEFNFGSWTYGLEAGKTIDVSQLKLRASLAVKYIDEMSQYNRARAILAMDDDCGWICHEDLNPRGKGIGFTSFIELISPMDQMTMSWYLGGGTGSQILMASVGTRLEYKKVMADVSLSASIHDLDYGFHMRLAYPIIAFNR